MPNKTVEVPFWYRADDGKEIDVIVEVDVGPIDRDRESYGYQEVEILEIFEEDGKCKLPAEVQKKLLATPKWVEYVEDKAIDLAGYDQWGYADYTPDDY